MTRVLKETEEYMLYADNSSWGTGKYTHSSLPKKSKRTRVSHSKLVSPSEVRSLLPAWPGRQNTDLTAI